MCPHYSPVDFWQLTADIKYHKALTSISNCADISQ